MTFENLVEVEEFANQIIFSSKALHTYWANQDTLHSFPLRKSPIKDFSEIRLVEIADFDYSACCGTHVATTGEIGLIKIRSWERKNNGVRIDFVCGWRALRDYQQKNSTIQQVSNRLSLPSTAILQGIEKQLLKTEALSKELISIKQEFYHNLATTLFLQGEIIGNYKLIVHVLTNTTPNEVNSLAKELVSNPQTIACICGTNTDETKIHLVFSASPDVPLSMNHELKNILPLLDGKGGGSPQSAQGGGSKIDQLPNALTLATSHIKEQLYLL
ncbi:DHHA1 domain-containing protein [Pelosinus propionicus]|uniref:DHHA1 domain-containing protein n=1 Tax=Pelosinus propionicus TaxID=380084 RepID=UPI001FE02473|nr:DHHA1 domain-containing protein [Pelosinus propionicus]